MRHILAAVVLTLVQATAAAREIYVVNPEGTGDFPTIQAALDAAGSYDIIELTDGVFRGEGNRDIETYYVYHDLLRSQSGNPETCIIDCEGSLADPHFGISWYGGHIKGITITNGYARYGPGGGALVCYRTHATIKNCIFSDNCAGNGGAVRCYGSPIIRDCTFTHNSATSGGGALYYRESSSPINLGYCRFVNNSANNGGAVEFRYCHSAVVIGCSFEENYAGWGRGGGIYFVQTQGIVTNCMFVANSADAWGGGIFFDSGSSMLCLSQCTFSRNSALAVGGGCRCLSPLSAYDCTLYANSAGQGGGLHCDDLAMIENTVIAFGLAGEAICCGDAGNPDLVCCDIYGNAGGDWVACIADQYGIDGNICEDPLFCNPENVDFTLAEDSPCAPFTPPNQGCDLIGAWPVGCGPMSVPDEFPPPERETATTWGGIKAAFR